MQVIMKCKKLIIYQATINKININLIKIYYKILSNRLSLEEINWQAIG